MEKFCFKFEESNITSEEIGNKAYALFRAKKIVPIPNGFFITTGAFDYFIKINGLEKVIDKTIKEYLSKKISGKEASSQIKKAFISSSIPEKIKEEISIFVFSLNQPFAVRSSSTAEDSENLSFAGLFNSYLDITSKGLGKKIKEVYASLFNERAIEYAYRNEIDLRDIKMGIIVQEMVKGDKFGVGFYFKENNEDMFIIESITGEPTGVTSGRQIPDAYVIRKEEISKYPRKININSLFDFEIQEVVSLMKKLKEGIFPLDIEFAFENSKLLLLQARPLTRKIPIPRGKHLLHGLPASPGEVCGRAIMWDKEKTSNLEKGKDRILIAEEIEIEDVESIKDFGGVILEVSGVTAHAAILSRELGIPCIVGVDEITKIVKPGEKLYIDGDIGKITFLERKSFSIKREYKSLYIKPRNLRYFRWRENMVLFLPEKEYVIVHNARLRDKLKEIIRELRKIVKKPLVDGGVDTWYGYGMILEMSQLNQDIYKDFLLGLKSIESLSPSKIITTINDYIKKAIDFYTKAEKSFRTYLNTKDRKRLGFALKNIDFAYAYWKTIGHCMLYDYAENILSTKDKSSSENLIKFIIEIEEDKELQEIGEKIVNLVGKILDTIKKDLDIDYSLYTSEIALLSSINIKKD